MAFENVRLTDEETEEIAARGIKNPYGSAAQIMDGIEPSYLTIDKDTDTWLTWCYRPREADENITEFLFMYKRFPITLQVVSTYNENSNQVYREITRLDLPEELIDERKEIKALIVSAFEVYKSTGWPDECEEKTKVICSFREGI